MKPKVIVYNKIPEKVMGYLQESCNVMYFEGIDSADNPDFLRELKEAEGIMGTKFKINKEFLEQGPCLKIVCTISVGYDSFDIPEITRRGIMTTNTPDVLTDTTADTIFGLLVATARRMPELDRYVKSGGWNQFVGENLFGVDVHHKTLGIIGMGRIGAAIAKRAYCGFDMKILYHNRSRNEEAEKRFQATYCELDELLRESDFVCLMTPLSPETTHLIGKREFNLMKKSAIFINGSRGSTVNEQDLIEALRNGEIAAAGLDVYEKEPVDAENPLLHMPNVVTLPHIGSATGETRFNMAMLAAENLVKGVTGQRPPSLINPEVWEGK